jgi:hypothetical protein
MVMIFQEESARDSFIIDNGWAFLSEIPPKRMTNQASSVATEATFSQTARN